MSRAGEANPRFPDARDEFANSISIGTENRRNVIRERDGGPISRSIGAPSREIPDRGAKSQIYGLHHAKYYKSWRCAKSLDGKSAYLCHELGDIY
jgi:hypothetical protein